MSHSHLSSAVTPLLLFTSVSALAEQHILASMKHAARVFKSYTYSAASFCKTLSMSLVTIAVVLILSRIATTDSIELS